MSSQSIKLYNQLAKSKFVNNSVNFNLSRIKLVLKKLNHPEKKLKNVINIIGSDGKFSVLTTLKYFIEASGKRTSAFISPSLKTIRDRFWMGNNYLSYNDIKNSLKIIENQKIKLTIFEIITVIFILNASKRNNDFNLIEAGALFAKDSTNVFNFPLVQVVTNINKQHLNFVKKKTIDEIIKQKVGFLSNFSNIYIGKQNTKNLRLIKKFLKNNYSKINYPDNWSLNIKNKKYFYKEKKNIIPMKSNKIYSKGLYQNLALSIKIALDLGISKQIIKRTIPKIIIEGRLQYISKGKYLKKIYKNEKIMLDGCHSSVSAKNLVSYLKEVKNNKVGILAMTKNKDHSNFLKNFKGVFNKILVVPLENNQECVPPEYLIKIAKKNNIVACKAKSLDQAIKKLSNKKSKIICIFGSLYLCGEFLRRN